MNNTKLLWQRLIVTNFMTNVFCCLEYPNQSIVSLNVKDKLHLSCIWTSGWMIEFKGALDKCNIIPNFFQKKVEIFIPLEGLGWVMTARWVLCSRLVYFWRNMNISSIFYFSKSTSINTQYSSLWDTLKMMLFTKYLIKWKRIGRISWKFSVLI